MPWHLFRVSFAKHIVKGISILYPFLYQQIWESITQAVCRD